MSDADLPFLARLYASTRHEEVARTGWPVEAQNAFLEQQHTAQHTHYQRSYPAAEWTIIERSQEPIGRLYWEVDHEPGDIRIIDISLIPQARGQGLGAALLEDLLDHARAIERTVSIHVEKNNPARSLYDRLGFALAEDRGVYDFLRAPRAERAS